MAKRAEAHPSLAPSPSCTQPFTAPKVSPRTRYFWKKRVSSTPGVMAISREGGDLTPGDVVPAGHSGEGDGQRLRVRSREDEGEEELVPREDEDEERRDGNPGNGTPPLVCLPQGDRAAACRTRASTRRGRAIGPPSITPRTCRIARVLVGQSEDDKSRGVIPSICASSPEFRAETATAIRPAVLCRRRLGPAAARPSSETSSLGSPSGRFASAPGVAFPPRSAPSPSFPHTPPPNRSIGSAATS